jgi:dipeptidyl aminopeptidase/acylaminoacyl peptidase
MELYTLNQHPLSNHNPIPENLPSLTPQALDFEVNGKKLKGWVMVPPNYNPKKKYPAILNIHGGPKTVYGTVYVHEMQVWAHQGYIVMFTNPTGSDGQDNSFSDIRGKYGTVDYDDLMGFVDAVIKGYPSIDTEKLGVTGGSYGGFMTNWIIGHTNRFACAITQRSISNWTSFYGVSDIGFYFATDQNQATLLKAKDMEKLWWHSPLKYLPSMKTPTLIIHSNLDYRCPVEQAYQLFTGLKEMKVPTKMVLFNNENHDLSRSGKPKARQKRLDEMVEWFDKYLK